MKTGRASAGRGLLAFALVAALGLTVVVSPASAGASRDARAVVAKKKCKKAKKGAVVAKKKKCKKVHHVVLPAPGPLVRATLSWSANNEVDLHAFDASGHQAGWDFNVNPPTGSLVNNIPNARHNGDVGPPGGSETFTDDLFVTGGPSNREFSFVACLYDVPDGADDYMATFTGVTKTGTTSTLPLNGTPSDGTDVYTLTVPGGPAIPNPGGVC